MKTAKKNPASLSKNSQTERGRIRQAHRLLSRVHARLCDMLESSGVYADSDSIDIGVRVSDMPKYSAKTQWTDLAISAVTYDNDDVPMVVDAEDIEDHEQFERSLLWLPVLEISKMVNGSSTMASVAVIEDKDRLYDNFRMAHKLCNVSTICIALASGDDIDGLTEELASPVFHAVRDMFIAKAKHVRGKNWKSAQRRLCNW